MFKSETVLEMTRRDAQELHKKIAADMARAKTATWADVKAAQTRALDLAAKMQPLAENQADSAKAMAKAAIGKLEAAGQMVESKAIDAKNDVMAANAALLESAHKAALSLSHAVADMRSSAAKAIAPKPSA